MSCLLPWHLHFRGRHVRKRQKVNFGRGNSHGGSRRGDANALTGGSQSKLLRSCHAAIQGIEQSSPGATKTSLTLSETILSQLPLFLHHNISSSHPSFETLIPIPLGLCILLNCICLFGYPILRNSSWLPTSTVPPTFS
jgi:hypothetical protein